jgi:hypothetical protein
MEEEHNRDEMRRLIAQRDNRMRAESLRQQLVDLQASEAAALQQVRGGGNAIQMAPQPPQLLLEYAQARVAERVMPELHVADDSDGEELRSATLRSKLAAARSAAAAAKLDAAAAALAATEAEMDEREAMRNSKRVRRE